MIEHMLKEAAEAFKYRRLKQTLTILQSALEAPELSLDEQICANTLQLRVYAEQGQFLKAQKICDRLNMPKNNNDYWGWARYFWCTFIAIYYTSNVNHALQTFSQILSSGIVKHIPRLQALACDLYARTIQMGFVLRWHGQGELPKVYEMLHECIALYNKVGQEDEAQSAMLRLGEYLNANGQRDAGLAQYNTVHDEAVDKLMRAQVALQLAEYDIYEAASSGQKWINDKNHLTHYEEALSNFDEIKHPIGVASSFLSFGNQLVKYGFDPQEPIQTALSLYLEQDHLSGQISCFNLLSQWCTYTGQPREAAKLLEDSLALAKLSGHPHGLMIAHMGLGDSYMRSGNYGKAQAQYIKSAQYNVTPLTNALIDLLRSNTFQISKQLDEAEKFALMAVEKLKQIEAYDPLSDAYFILGNLYLSQKRYVESRSVYQVGIELDQRLNNPRSHALKLSQIGISLAIEHHPSDQSPPLSSQLYGEIRGIFKQSIDLVTPLQDLAARAVEANIFQLIGQTDLFINNHVGVEENYENAFHIYSETNMQMQRAMTATMLGWLYFEVARKGQRQFFQNALNYHSIAHDYFSKCNMLDKAATSAFALGICLEAAGMFARTEEDQNNKWIQAQHILLAASVFITFVRGSIVDPNASRQEKARLIQISLHEKTYALALRISRYLKQPLQSWIWVQQNKGRILNESIALRLLPSPDIADTELIKREKDLLNIMPSSGEVEFAEYIEELRGLWDLMEGQAPDYVALRRAEPISWRDTQLILKNDEALIR